MIAGIGAGIAGIAAVGQMIVAALALGQENSGETEPVWLGTQEAGQTTDFPFLLVTRADRAEAAIGKAPADFTRTRLP